MEVIIASQFKIVQKIGEGSFGEIFQAVGVKRGQKVAIKVENSTAKCQQLLHEAKVIEDMIGKDSLTDKGIPNIYAKGKQGQFNYIVMDLLGPSLQTLLQTCNGTFTMKTTLMVADQMLKRIEYVHSKGYVHRDIKPENFLLSAKQDRKVYLIDYGISRKYIKNGSHIPYADGKHLVGTARYVSLNNHYGVEATRRDDLESWFYCLYYFLLGKLPWQGQKALTRDEKHMKIFTIKLENRPQVMCTNLPNQLLTVLRHIKNLKYDENPNYELLKKSIRNIMKAKHYEYDYYYDWEIKKDSMSKIKG